MENGILGAVDGYFFTGVDAMKVTCSQKPEETVYLKGFVGETYTGSSFEPGDGESFQDTVLAWKTEGDPSVYIQNLPFLRMMYYETTADQPVTAAQITVENKNANTQYTYVPYNASLMTIIRFMAGTILWEDRLPRMIFFLFTGGMPTKRPWKAIVTVRRRMAC